MDVFSHRSGILNLTHTNTTLTPTDNVTLHPPPDVSGPPRSGPLNPVCNVCDLHCVLSAVSLVFLVGVVANGLVIILVVKDDRLHTTTFITIAALALADLLFLATNLAMSVEELLVVFQCVDMVTDTEYFRGAMSVLWKNAKFQVVHLAIVRYIILVHPLKARQLFTNKRVIWSIVVVWSLALFYHGMNRAASYIEQDTTIEARQHRIVNWCVSYFLPLVAISVLHILKLCAVRRSAMRAMSSMNRRVRAATHFGNMSRVIALVLAAELILPLPQFILFILIEWTDVRYPNKDTEHAVKIAAYFLYLLNFSINPFIYAFSSPEFRKRLGKLCIKEVEATPIGPRAVSRATSTGSGEVTKCSVVEMAEYSGTSSLPPTLP